MYGVRILLHPNPHQYYCGVDLHARSMYVCIVHHAGEILVHRHMKAAPELFLNAVAPDRDGLVVAVECLFTWYGLADLCAQEGMPVGLGHALYMKAMHGGKAKHDTIDAHKIAALRRGGMLPQASVYPAERRAIRDLWRRRTHLMRQRAALLAPVQHPHSPYNRPESGQKIADQANRAGGAARVADPAVHKRGAVDLALITSDDQRLGDRARSLVQAATHPEANTLYLVQTGPGLGTIRSLVRRYDIHDMARFPRGQDVVSSGRLVTWAKASAGTRWGPSGHTIGTGHLKGACSEAAVLCLRTNPAGQTYWARVEKTHGQGTALTILAHKRARAVYDRLTRQTAVEMDTCRHGEGSSAGAPHASRATPGISRSQACSRSCWTASLNAKVRIGFVSQRPGR
jgi:transposase